MVGLLAEKRSGERGDYALENYGCQSQPRPRFVHSSLCQAGGGVCGVVEQPMSPARPSRPCPPKVQERIPRTPDLNQQMESKGVTVVRFVIFMFRVIGVELPS
jgi:hypothetical protein